MAQALCVPQQHVNNTFPGGLCMTQRKQWFVDWHDRESIFGKPPRWISLKILIGEIVIVTTAMCVLAFKKQMQFEESPTKKDGPNFDGLHLRLEIFDRVDQTGNTEPLTSEKHFLFTTELCAHKLVHKRPTAVWQLAAREQKRWIGYSCWMLITAFYGVEEITS